MADLRVAADDLQAEPTHNADERIDVRDLGYAAGFYANLARELLG